MLHGYGITTISYTYVLLLSFSYKGMLSISHYLHKLQRTRVLREKEKGKAIIHITKKSELALGERVIDRAQVRPVLRDWVRDSHIRDVLGHDDRKAGVEVGLDVAVEEPRAGVVRLEPDRDVVSGSGRAGADDVPPDWVVVVVLCATRGANDSEDVLRTEGKHTTLER